jgi:hypothetical protein
VQPYIQTQSIKSNQHLDIPPSLPYPSRSEGKGRGREEASRQNISGKGNDMAEENAFATPDQTWAIFTLAQVDVRNLEPPLTKNQASTTLGKMITCSDQKKAGSISRTQFETEKSEWRSKLITAGGVDKKNAPKQEKSATPSEATPDDNRFDL